MTSYGGKKAAGGRAPTTIRKSRGGIEVSLDLFADVVSPFFLSLGSGAVNFKPKVATKGGKAAPAAQISPKIRKVGGGSGRPVVRTTPADVARGQSCGAIFWARANDELALGH